MTNKIVWRQHVNTAYQGSWLFAVNQLSICCQSADYQLLISCKSDDYHRQSIVNQLIINF